MKPIRWLAPLPAAAAAMLAWSPASAQTATRDTTHAQPPAADFQGMGRNLHTPERRAGDPYELSALDEQPVLLNREEASRAMEDRYPPEQRRQGVGGLVVLRFVIQADGTVDPASVTVEMATNPAFSEPAANVVRQMRFRPGAVKNTPVRTWVTLPVNFQAPTAPSAPSTTIPPER